MKIEIVGLRVHPFIEYFEERTHLRKGKPVVRKYKLQTPEAHYFVSYSLRVDADLKLNGIYIDDNDFKWCCISVMHYPKLSSTLRSLSEYLPKDEIFLPTEIRLLQNKSFE